MAKHSFKYRPPPGLLGVSPRHGHQDHDDKAPEPAEHADEAAEGAGKAAPERSWHQSSWDLMRGLQVRDNPDDIPSQLFEELFPPR